MCSVSQIVHLKRFQFVNGRWIKSQKIVKFPRENFDPSAFLAPRDLEQHCLHSRSESEDLLRVGEDNLSSISAPAGFCHLNKGTTCGFIDFICCPTFYRAFVKNLCLFKINTSEEHKIGI